MPIDVNDLFYSTTRAELAAYITKFMPQLDPKACVDACAEDIAAYLWVLRANTASNFSSVNLVADFALEAVEQEPLLLAINAGSNISALYEGIEFQADEYSTGGMPGGTHDPIAGTAEDDLFQSERYGSYSYEIPVTEGVFTIRLYMAEIHHTAAGLRSFNVYIENELKLNQLDLFSQVGHDGAYEYIVGGVRVVDGYLSIKLESVINNATLSGFAVFSSGSQLKSISIAR